MEKQDTIIKGKDEAEVKDVPILTELERLSYHIQVLAAQSRQLNAEFSLTNKFLEEAQEKFKVMKEEAEKAGLIAPTPQTPPIGVK